MPDSSGPGLPVPPSRWIRFVPPVLMLVVFLAEGVRHALNLYSLLAGDARSQYVRPGKVRALALCLPAAYAVGAIALLRGRPAIAGGIGLLATGVLALQLVALILSRVPWTEGSVRGWSTGTLVASAYTAVALVVCLSFMRWVLWRTQPVRVHSSTDERR